MSNEEQLPEIYGETRTRAEIAYSMKMRGMSLSEIALELHCDTSNVTNMIKAQLAIEAAAVPDEERAGILALENARLDFYLSKLWPSIEYGDVKSIAQALKISEMRLKANRLDEPVSDNRTQVLVIGGESQNYIDKLKELTGDA